jgi:hypothetical protein
MDQPRQVRPDAEPAVRRSVSLVRSLALATAEQARKEGHYNFSFIVAKALIAYLNRENDVRAA